MTQSSQQLALFQNSERSLRHHISIDIQEGTCTNIPHWIALETFLKNTQNYYFLSSVCVSVQTQKYNPVAMLPLVYYMLHLQLKLLGLRQNKAAAYANQFETAHCIRFAFAFLVRNSAI